MAGHDGFKKRAAPEMEGTMLGRRSAALLAGLMLLSACTVHDQHATRAQGAGAGAALGAGLGALIGGGKEDVLIGAAAGGLAGLALGDAVARKKASYASQEEMIVQERRILSEQADEVSAYNAGLERRLRVLDRDIASLEAEALRGRDERAAKRDLRRRAAADLSHARKRLAEVDQEIGISRKVYEEALRGSEPVDLVEWDRRILELERRRDALAELIGDFELSTDRLV